MAIRTCSNHFLRGMCRLAGRPKTGWYQIDSRELGVQMTDKACSICSRPFIDDHVIPINGSEEQVEHLRQELASRHLLLGDKKGSKKRKLREKEAALEILSAEVLRDKEAGLEILSTEVPANDSLAVAGGFGSPVV